MGMYSKNILKIGFFILLIFCSVIADASKVKEKIIYTIQANSARSIQDLDETIFQLSNYKDLWIRYDKGQNQYSLMIGVFKQEREAQYLLGSLHKRVQQNR